MPTNWFCTNSDKFAFRGLVEKGETILLVTAACWWFCLIYIVHESSPFLVLLLKKMEQKRKSFCEYTFMTECGLFSWTTELAKLVDGCTLPIWLKNKLSTSRNKVCLCRRLKIFFKKRNKNKTVPSLAIVGSC